MVPGPPSCAWVGGDVGLQARTQNRPPLIPYGASGGRFWVWSGSGPVGVRGLVEDVVERLAHGLPGGETH